MDLHHVHLFCSDIEATVQWWIEMMGAEVAFDGEMGGSRNVFMRIGEGRLHLYDQHPKGDKKNAVHHIGIRCTNLVQIYDTLKGKGVVFGAVCGSSVVGDILCALHRMASCWNFLKLILIRWKRLWLDISPMQPCKHRYG